MIIVSKFPGRCNTCNQPVKVGDRVEWSRQVRGVSHEACVQNAAAVEDAKQKALFAERERLQEQTAFMGDMGVPPDPPSEPPPPSPRAPTFEEYARTLEVPF